MAFKQGNRHQQILFPPSIEEYVADDDVVRGYDAIIDGLDINSLGLVVDDKKVGAPSYDPKSMLKLLVYGYSYGVSSLRKLERECHYNLSFIWLTGGLKPDHKTIAEWRRKNIDVLKNTLKETARIGIKLGLIDGVTLFIDGSQIRGNAWIRNSWTNERAEEALKKIDSRISEVLKECDEIDKSEEGSASLVKLDEELKSEEKLKSKVENIIAVLKESGKKSREHHRPGCCIAKWGTWDMCRL